MLLEFIPADLWLYCVLALTISFLQFAISICTDLSLRIDSHVELSEMKHGKFDAYIICYTIMRILTWVGKYM